MPDSVQGLSAGYLPVAPHVLNTGERFQECESGWQFHFKTWIRPLACGKKCFGCGLEVTP